MLEERYKDVTFETLNAPDFLYAVKTAFPTIDWDKAYANSRLPPKKSRIRTRETFYYADSKSRRPRLSKILRELIQTALKAIRNC